MQECCDKFAFQKIDIHGEMISLLKFFIVWSHSFDFMHGLIARHLHTPLNCDSKHSWIQFNFKNSRHMFDLLGHKKKLI